MKALPGARSLVVSLSCPPLPLGLRPAVWLSCARRASRAATSAALVGTFNGGCSRAQVLLGSLAAVGELCRPCTRPESTVKEMCVTECQRG